jgi:hypothetical protein
MRCSAHTTAQSDFSNTYTSVVRLSAFTDRPSQTAEGVLEISRFSCMLSNQRAWALRLRRTGQPLAITQLPCCLPPTQQGVGILFQGFFEAQSPRPLIPPAYASKLTSRWVPQD